MSGNNHLNEFNATKKSQCGWNPLNRDLLNHPDVLSTKHISGSNCVSNDTDVLSTISYINASQEPTTSLQNYNLPYYQDTVSVQNDNPPSSQDIPIDVTMNSNRTKKKITVHDLNFENVFCGKIMTEILQESIKSRQCLENL